MPRQGYHDYSRRETSADRCERTKQWILFKAGTPAVLDRLLSMDFAALSQKLDYRNCQQSGSDVDRPARGIKSFETRPAEG